MKLLNTVLVMGLLASAPGIAAAQDASATANYGEISLSTGFTPDPYHVDVVSGGSLEASKLGSACSGTISNAPDLQVTFSAGSLPLIIRTQSDSDTTLVVNGPDGSWYCDDDGSNALNALVRFNSPRSGVYDIWVGSYSSGTNPSATLLVSELEDSTYTPDNSASSEQPDSSLRPSYGSVTLASGFTPDPRVVSLRAGGTIPAGNASSDCTGSIAKAPDYRIEYTAGSQPLIVRTRSSVDTTLVVNDPSGEWVCDDDGAGNSNAQVIFEKPASGTYDVWVGTYSGGNSPATLLFTERR